MLRSNRLKCAAFLVLLPVLLVIGACNRDPRVVSEKYVQNGNKYFEKEKYKEASLMYRQALSKNRLNGNAYYRLALTNLKLNDYSGAYRSLLRAVELLKDKPEVRAEYADSMTKLADITLLAYLADKKRPPQRLAEVKNLADDLLKLDPRSFAGMRLKGYLALANGEQAEGIKIFEEANRIKPFETDVVLVLIQAFGGADRFPEGEALWTSAVEKNKASRPLYDIMYVEYMKQDRPADAERVFKTGEQNNPNDSYYPTRLAYHYLAVRKPAETERVLESMLAKPKSYPQALKEVGDFYFRIGALDKSLKYYYQGTQSGSAEQKAEYQKRVIEVLVQQGKKSEAAQLVEVLVKQNPKDQEASAIRAALTLDTGNKEQIQQSIQDLQNALASPSMQRNPVLRFNLGRAFVAKGDYEQAKLQFQDAINDRPDYVPARLALGQLLLIKGDFTGAQKCADETLERSPNHLAARLIRSSATASLGNNAGARKELLETVKLYPQSKDAKFQLGVVSFQEKKYKEAEQIFNELRASTPADPRPTLALADVLMVQGQAADARKLLQAEVAKDGNRSEYRSALANLGSITGDRAMAIEQLTAMMTKSPNDPNLYLRLGSVYRQSGDLKGAIEAYKRAKEKAPDNVEANLGLGMMLESTGDTAQAKALYEQVLKVQPDNPIALNNLAYRLAENGIDLDQAMTLAQRARQKQPEDSNVADTLGWIYIKKNLSDEAIKIYSVLVQKNPTHVTWRYHLAMALYQKGDKVQTRKELETCLKNKPNKEEESKIRELRAKVS